MKGVGGMNENIEIAKFNIGLLKMLDEKTKGNLTEEENSYLQGVILNSMEKLREHSL